MATEPGRWSTASPTTGHGRSIAGVSRPLLAMALCLAAAGCSVTAATPTTFPSPAAATPSRSPFTLTPAQAMDTQGPYHLVFELPQTDWHTTDSITGTATLSFVGAGGVDYVAWGGQPLLFSFDEVGGSRRVVGQAFTNNCPSHRLDAGQPFSSPIFKSGSYTMNGPDSDFYGSFFKDPLLHLPVGDWTITAVASFGTDTAGGSDIRAMLKAAVLVHVTA